MGALRERGLRERRARILGAARDALVEDGADALSMRQLAQRAGVSVATLYNRFGSKEAILAALFEVELESLAASLPARGGEDPIARCRALLEASLNRFVRQAALFRQLLGAIERQGASPARSALMARSTELIGAAIESAVAQGQLRRDVSPTIVARHVVWGYVQAIRYWSTGDLTHEGFRAQTLSVLWIALLSVSTERARPALTAELEEVTPMLLKISGLPPVTEAAS